MTDKERAEIVDRILKAEADLTKDGEEYIERTRIIRIIRGLE